MILLGSGAVVVFVVLLFVAVDAHRRSAAVARELERLRRRVDALDRRTGGVEAEGAPQGEVAAGAISSAAGPAAPPGPAAAPLVPAIPGTAPGDGAAPDPVAAAPPGVTVAAPATPPAAGPRPRRDVEQLVGGVWLQNAGAVLLLTGFFFLILWGYATGRFGPGALVLAGVFAGLGLVWRGARMRRSVRGVGHALIGVGAGVVWLAVYLGHFRLGVLNGPAAFALVTLASVLTGALGLRYRAQGITALGVVGAHLPNVLEALAPLDRFSLPVGALLGYLAAVNAMVFALAARAGWSALALASLLLTAATWIGAVPATRWSWPAEIGLALLFAGLGLSPLPRLVRAAGRVRAIDLAVIAVAPLALLAASAPMFAIANARLVAILLLALAVIYLAASLWVDGRRPERDLWKPLTAAAVLFVTAALERAAGPERTALAWTVEGVALVLLGLRPRGMWLRVCGTAVIYLGGIAVFMRLMLGLEAHPLPVVNAAAIQALLAIAALLFAAHHVRRAKAGLGPVERFVSTLWYLGAHVLLAFWLAREAHHLAWALERDGGAWRAVRDVQAGHVAARYASLFAATTSLAWFAQAAWLVRAGLGVRGMVARLAALGLAALAAAPIVFMPWYGTAWGGAAIPLVHRDALLALGSIAIAAVSAAALGRARAQLQPFERRMSEIWAAGAALMLLVWIGREADQLARAMLAMPVEAAGQGPPAARRALHALAGMLTSVGWLLEAVAAFVIGWLARSAFMRWMGLALIGVTVLKFLFVDLASADPFWRFLIAIGAGAAMLSLSYVYQRLGASRRGPPAA